MANNNHKAGQYTPPHTNQTFEELMAAPPIHYKEKKFGRLLNDAQANILRHHRSTYSACIFISIKEKEKSKAAAWISELAKAGFFTSAYQQFEDRANDIYAVNCLYLTSEGYQELDIEKYAPAKNEFPAFWEGMENRTSFDKRYLDEGMNKFGQNSSPLHAMLLLTNDDEQELKNSLNEVINTGGINIGGNILKVPPLHKWADYYIQPGFIKRNAKGKAVEWFGYVDGISQPKFFPNPVHFEYRNADLSNLNTVFVKDKGGSPFGVGSFLAFLKLEQDIAGFNKMVNAVKDKINNKNKALAGAYIMGRFRDGTPVTLSDAPSGNPGNGFDYHNIFRKKDHEYYNDKNGTRCPWHAHIRKANPRMNGDGNGDNWELKKIVRRGILYNDGNKPKEEEPVKEKANDMWDKKDNLWNEKDNLWGEKDKPRNVGMLFMSFQASIQYQFEHILTWLHGNKTGKTITGKDPLTGTRHLMNPPLAYPKSWNTKSNKNKTPVKFSEPCVRLKGGSYFYAPSLSFLKNVARYSRPAILKGPLPAIAKIANAPLAVDDGKYPLPALRLKV
ncbi:MAG TPA: hypothetical protein ENJ95_03955 [Bacteroidetes bacterium]|nr:hypothetical protein [Bacteroidota bacterium]